MPPRQPIPDHLRADAFGPSTVGFGRNRLRSPDLLRPHHGARIVRGGPLDPAVLTPDDALRARCEVALRWCGSAYLDGITAARLWPLPMPGQPAADEPLHLSTFFPDRAPRRPGIVSRQITDADVRIVHRNGLPMMDPAAVFCHLGLYLSIPDLVAVGDALVLTPRQAEPGRPYLTLAELSQRVGWYRGRGKRRVAQALPLVRPGAESRPETLLRLQLVSAGLPEPAVNQDIRTTSGYFLARVDLVFETWRVLIEYDGDHHRVDRAQWNRDITRQERLVAEGWTVIRVTAQTLFVDPTSVTRRVRAALMAAGWQP